MCFQCYYFVDVIGISNEIVECDDNVDVEFLALCFCWLPLVSEIVFIRSDVQAIRKYMKMFDTSFESIIKRLVPLLKCF